MSGIFVIVMDRDLHHMDVVVGGVITHNMMVLLTHEFDFRKKEKKQKP